MKVLGTYVGTWEYRSISRAPTQSKLLVVPMIRIAFVTKEDSSIDTDVTIQGIPWNTWGQLVEIL